MERWPHLGEARAHYTRGIRIQSTTAAIFVLSSLDLRWTVCHCLFAGILSMGTRSESCAQSESDRREEMCEMRGCAFV